MKEKATSKCYLKGQFHFNLWSAITFKRKWTVKAKIFFLFLCTSTHTQFMSTLWLCLMLFMDAMLIIVVPIPRMCVSVSVIKEQRVEKKQKLCEIIKKNSFCCFYCILKVFIWWCSYVFWCLMQNKSNKNFLLFTCLGISDEKFSRVENEKFDCEWAEKLFIIERNVLLQWFCWFF